MNRRNAKGIQSSISRSGMRCESHATVLIKKVNKRSETQRFILNKQEKY